MGLGLELGLRLGGGGRPRSFADFGTLVALYDFTDPTKLFTDTGRTTGVSADGDVIAGVTAGSGSFHLSQSDGTATPTYRTNVLNGRSVARFDGVNDFLQTASNFGTDAGLSGDASFSVFVVARKTTVTKGSLYGWGNTVVALQAAGIYDDNSIFGFAYSGGNNFLSTAVANNTWHLRSTTKAPGAINATTTIRRNGASVASGTPSTSTPNISGSQSFALGRWANLTGNYFEGDVALLALYSGVVSDLSGLETFINSYVGGVY